MVIHLNQITKIYYSGEIAVPALKNISLVVEPGEFIAVMGSSGSGKTTLMNIIGCLDKPTSGQYFLEEKNVTNLNRNELAHIRNKKIGFIFQNFNLLPLATALENVELPLYYAATRSPDGRRDGNDLPHQSGVSSGRQKRQRANELLNRLGLGHRLNHRPTQLSGGEQQRVAIARALVNQPPLVLADEPTGNLDSKTSHEIMTLFKQLNQDGITIILITHEKDIADYAKRLIYLKDGQVVV